MSLDLLFPNFETLIRTPEDVARLNEAILRLAVQGKLVPQDPADEPASELLKRIRAEKRRLVKAGRIRDTKPLPTVHPDEIPHQLPRQWMWCRLGDIGDWGSGATPKRGESKYYDDGAIPWLKTGELNDGFIDSSEEFVTESAFKETSLRLNQPGDVLIAMYGATIGKLGILRIAATTNQACCACTPFVGVSNLFLFYYLRSLREQLKSLGAGGAQPNISKEKIVASTFPLPPLAEQRRIVAKVESLFAQTRALEAKLRQAQADIVTVNRAALNRLSVAADADAFASAWATVRDAFDLLYDDPRNVAELRQAILQLAVQGKLVPQDPADEPASELLKRIRAEKRRLVKEGKIQSENTLPAISPGEMAFHPPIGWHWVKLNELAEIVSGVTKGRNLVHFDTISLPYLRVANVQRGYLDLSEIKEIEIKADEKSKYLLRNGDLLLTEGGDADKLGRAAIWREQIKECLHQNHIFRARPYSPELPAEWLMLYTNSAYGRGYFLESSKQTTNLASINSTQLKNCPIILPPVAEQKRILTKVDQLMRQCDALAAGLARAEGQRRALTAAALHGAFG